MFNAYKTNIVRLNNKYKNKRFLTKRDFGNLNNNLIFLSNEINKKRYDKTKEPIVGTILESGFMDLKWNYISNALFKNSIANFPYAKINRYAKKQKILSDNKKMKIFFRLSNAKSAICFAGAGSGKTSTIVLPTILANALSPTKPNLFITDPKGELSKATFNLLKENGYNVRVINILDEKNSDSFSPFTVIKDILFEISKFPFNDKNRLDPLNVVNAELINIIFSLDENPKTTKKDIWDSSALTAIYLIAWLIIDDLMLKFDSWLMNNHNLNESDKRKQFDNLFIKFSFQSIFWTLSQFGDDGTPKYVQFYKDKFSIDIYHATPFEIYAHPGILKWQQVFRENNGKSTFTIDVNTNAMKEIEKFNMPSLKKITIFNTFDLNDLYGEMDKPTALFIAINNVQQETIPYVRWFVNYVLMKISDFASSEGRAKLKKPLMCIFEEIGNIGYVKHLPNVVNEGRGRNIFASMFFQTYDQYLQNYNNTSGGFVKSCEYRILLTNSESSQFANELSKYCGEYIQFDKKNNKYNKLPRLTIDNIFSIPPFKAMIFMNQINIPYSSGLIPWYLLGIKSLDRLNIKIDDPNYISTFEAVYNPLNDENNIEVKTSEPSNQENINQKNEYEIKNDKNLNQLFNDESKQNILKFKETKFKTNNKLVTENINLNIYKEDALNKKEKFLCEILKIKYGSPDVQIVKNIILEQNQFDDILYLNNKSNLNQILNRMFNSALSTILNEKIEWWNLENEIQIKEPNRINHYKQIKEFLILKDLVNHSSWRNMSFQKFVEIKNSVILIQQINQKQFTKLNQYYQKTSLKAIEFLATKINSEVKFNTIFQFNSSFIRSLKENLKNDEIPQEIKKYFKILDVTN